MLVIAAVLAILKALLRSQRAVKIEQKSSKNCFRPPQDAGALKSDPRAAQERPKEAKGTKKEAQERSNIDQYQPEWGLKNKQFFGRRSEGILCTKDNVF